jgi:hypothetical protein
MSVSITNSPGYFQRYINLVSEADCITALSNQVSIIEQFLNLIGEEQSQFAYDRGKWTVKEMVQHIIDTERIFGYRALCFARGEQQALPGFDENDYAANMHINNRSWKSIGEELLVTRQNTLFMFKGFHYDALHNKGTASNNQFTVAEAGMVIAGHFYHHQQVFTERYWPVMQQ